MLPTALRSLIDSLSQLPSVGPKTAQRYAIHLLKQPQHQALGLATALQHLHRDVGFCSQCFHWADASQHTGSSPLLCDICKNPKRHTHSICVVETPQDVYALERMQTFKGTYHVLGGLISPLAGVGPEHLTLRPLLERLQQSDAPELELVLALPPSAEGDTTSLYIAGLLKPLNLGIQLTRLAYGLPVGGDLDYADQLTLAKAFAGRTQL
ncbi:MAG: recombination mediator RecR [Vampirovibrionales bacterium]